MCAGPVRSGECGGGGGMCWSRWMRSVKLKGQEGVVEWRRWNGVNDEVEGVCIGDGGRIEE